MDNKKSHELLCKLKDLAVELGRAPTKREFQQAGITRYEMDEVFGGFKPMLQAAGIKVLKGRKIDNSVFEVKDIENHLDKYTGEEEFINPTQILAKNFAVISDIHWPFHSKKAFETFFERARKKKYDAVIINGDARDMYCHMKYPRSHNVFTPREENRVARELNEKFWKDVKSIRKDTKCFQLMGNHDIRPLKKALEKYPEAEDWISEALTREFKFEGVTTLMDTRDVLIMNKNILIFHGFKLKLGDHRDWTRLSCIVGHTHRPGLMYRRMMNDIIHEANSGSMGNPAAKGLTYTASKITEQVGGFLEYDEDGGRFISAHGEKITKKEPNE